MGQIYRRIPFTKSGSPNLAVDGSVTPVVFDISEFSFESFSVRSIEVFGRAKGRSFDLDDFFTIDGLTNGIALVVNSVNEDFTGPGVKTNADLKEVFDVGSDIDRGRNNVCYRGTIRSDGASLFVLDAAATAELSVEDDLTDIDYLSFSFEGIVIE